MPAFTSFNRDLKQIGKTDPRSRSGNPVEALATNRRQNCPKGFEAAVGQSERLHATPWLPYPIFAFPLAAVPQMPWPSPSSHLFACPSIARSSNHIKLFPRFRRSPANTGSLVRTSIWWIRICQSGYAKERKGRSFVSDWHGGEGVVWGVSSVFWPEGAAGWMKSASFEASWS